MSLEHIAAAFERNGFLEFGLDAFGDNFQPKEVSKADRGADNGDILDITPPNLATVSVARTCD